MTLLSFQQRDQIHLTSLYSVPFETTLSALTRVSKTQLSANRITATNHWFCVDSHLDAVKQEKHLFALAIFFNHHGLRSDFVGPKVATRKTKTCPTDWTVYGGQITNANKKILVVSWFCLRHLLDMLRLHRPPQEKFGKEKSQSDSKGSSSEFRQSQK
jgi:hypothetical protein